ncbi:MAG: putative negative regulator of RcsB-dependent stress response [Flavobacteriales bacterium]
MLSVADHLTEEEQIETIKRWWKENWLSIALPIALALIAYTGWNFWTAHKQDQAQAASDQYQQLLSVVGVEGVELSEDQIATASSLAISIAESYEGTLYADMSQLILAKLAVNASNLDAAQLRLNNVVANGSTESIKMVANARLAKVLLAQGQYSEALALVNVNVSDANKALYAEIRGDVYFAQNDLVAANTAFKVAQDSLGQQDFSRQGILRFKLDATKLDEPAEEAVESEVTVEPEVAVTVEAEDAAAEKAE